MEEGGAGKEEGSVVVLSGERKRERKEEQCNEVGSYIRDDVTREY